MVAVQVLDGDTVIGGAAVWLTVPSRGGLVVEQAAAAAAGLTAAGADGLPLGVAEEVTVAVAAGGVVVETFFFGLPRSWFSAR